MKKSGLTLMEVLLTTVLFSILLAGIFGLSDSQKKTIDLMKDNNLALFTFESLKNKALHYNEMLQLKGELKKSFAGKILDDEKWQINLNLDEHKLFIEMIKDKNNNRDKRRYIKKVTLTNE